MSPSSDFGSRAAASKHPLVRALTVVTAVLAVIITLGLLPPQAAADDGSTPAAPRKVVKGDPYKLVGAKVAAQLKAAQSINEHATGPKRKVLDYKLAKKHDKGHSTVRRQFAASWLWTGKSIKNISRKETRIVRSYVKKYFGTSTPPPGWSATALNAPARCRGKGGFESLGGGAWNGWLSSCSTALLIAELRYGGIVVGLIATKMGPYAPAGVTAAVLMEVGAESIDLLRAFSPYGAIVIIRRLVGPANAPQQVFTILPQ